MSVQSQVAALNRIAEKLIAARSDRAESAWAYEADPVSTAEFKAIILEKISRLQLSDRQWLAVLTCAEMIGFVEMRVMALIARSIFGEDD